MMGRAIIIGIVVGFIAKFGPKFFVQIMLIAIEHPMRARR